MIAFQTVAERSDFTVEEIMRNESGGEDSWFHSTPYWRSRFRQPLELLNWWELRVALQETDHLYQVWDAVRDARCDYYYVTVRRLALKRLRDLVGEEAYYSSNLPPCVPLWRFEQIR